MKFCKNCGYGFEEHVEVCGNCNTVLTPENSMTDEKLKVLSNRIKINGILWLVIGILQCFSAVFCIVGVLNIISAVQDLQTSKTVFHYRVGLVQAYKPMTGFIITLLYNLIFGGVIGIVGSLYYYFGIRQYVMDNKDFFDKLR